MIFLSGFQLLSIAFSCFGNFLLIWIITLKPIVSKNFFQSISGHRVWIKHVMKEVFQKLWWFTLSLCPERLKVLVVNEILIVFRRHLFITSKSLNCEYGNENTSCGKNISFFAIKWLIWIFDNFRGSITSTMTSFRTQGLFFC